MFAIIKQILIIGFLGIALLSNSQKVFSGKLIDSDSQKPVAGASVFLSNTSTGTVSQEDGSFIINSFPEGRYDFVVSIIGYETKIIPLNSFTMPSFLEIILTPKIKELEEVIVESYEKNGWEKWGTFFMNNLIGKTPNALECILLNSEVVKFRFDKKENIIRAFADEPLVIRNEALGYELKFDLSLFEFNFRANIFYYQGYPLFIDLVTNRKGKEKRWLQNRQETYLGSMMHFMRSLYRNQLVEDGFELRRIIKKRNKSTEIQLGGVKNMEDMDILVNIPLNGDSIAFAIDSVTAGIQFTDYLQVVNPAKKMPDMYKQQNRRVGINQPMTAELYMPDPKLSISVLANGSHFNGKDLIALEYWAWSEKLSNLLPLDYENPPGFTKPRSRKK